MHSALWQLLRHVTQGIYCYVIASQKLNSEFTLSQAHRHCKTNFGIQEFSVKHIQLN